MVSPLPSEPPPRLSILKLIIILCLWHSKQPFECHHEAYRVIDYITAYLSCQEKVNLLNFPSPLSPRSQSGGQYCWQCSKRWGSQKQNAGSRCLLTAGCQGLAQLYGDKSPWVIEEKWDQRCQGSDGQLATTMLRVTLSLLKRQESGGEAHFPSDNILVIQVGDNGDLGIMEWGIKGVSPKNTWSHQTVTLSGKTTKWPLITFRDTWQTIFQPPRDSLSLPLSPSQDFM